MITDSIITFVFSVFDWIFAKLPIPSIPTFYTFIIKPFFFYFCGIGQGLIMWIIPDAIYSEFWSIMYGLISVNLLYSLYRKFHKFK